MQSSLYPNRERSTIRERREIGLIIGSKPLSSKNAVNTHVIDIHDKDMGRFYCIGNKSIHQQNGKLFNYF